MTRPLDILNVLFFIISLILTFRFDFSTGDLFSVLGGTLILADIMGLPTSTGNCMENVFGFHIHEGDDCDGTDEDPFADVGMHYNPQNCKHPYHAGDLPPLFGNHGIAWIFFFSTSA